MPDRFPGQQHSVCSPSFDKTIPAGAHVLGLHGHTASAAAAGGGTGFARLGVVYSVPPASPAADLALSEPPPYAAERDAVSLSFLRSFYDREVRPLEDAAGGRALSTDDVAKRVIMRGAWTEADGRARRFAELLEASQRWAGPAGASGAASADMYFISHAFGNSFRLVVESLEAHFKAAGATPDSVFVWLGAAARPAYGPLTLPSQLCPRTISYSA